MAIACTAATDRITTGFTSESTLRSYSFRAVRLGSGGGNLGRFFEKTSSVLVYYDVVAGVNVMQRPHSVSAGDWRWSDGIDQDVWYNYVITYDSALVTNVPIIYTDGQESSLTTINPVGTPNSNANAHVIGNRPIADRVFNGNLAEFAIWDRILTQGEATAIAKGFRPSAMLNSLVCYLPMVRDTYDLKGAAPTLTGTSVVTHPRIIG